MFVLGIVFIIDIFIFRVFLVVGGNDLSTRKKDGRVRYAQCPHQVVWNLSTLLQKVSIHTEACIIALCPRKGLDKAITEVNNSLASLSAGNPNFQFIDTRNLINESHLAPDGVHLNDCGLRILKIIIEFGI